MKHTNGQHSQERKETIPPAPPKSKWSTNPPMRQSTAPFLFAAIHHHMTTSSAFSSQSHRWSYRTGFSEDPSALKYQACLIRRTVHHTGSVSVETYGDKRERTSGDAIYWHFGDHNRGATLVVGGWNLKTIQTKWLHRGTVPAAPVQWQQRDTLILLVPS